MSDAWSYLQGGSGDAWARLGGSSGDAWSRLYGSTGDAWVRLTTSTGSVYLDVELLGSEFTLYAPTVDSIGVVRNAIITCGLHPPGTVHRPSPETPYGPIKTPLDMEVDTAWDAYADLLAAELGLEEPAILTGPELSTVEMEGSILPLTIVGEAELFRGAGLAYSPLSPSVETNVLLSTYPEIVTLGVTPYSPTLEKWYRVDLTLLDSTFQIYSPNLSTAAEVLLPTLTTEWFPWQPVPNEGTGHDAEYNVLQATILSPTVETS
jgi:hypothetical protein